MAGLCGLVLVLLGAGCRRAEFATGVELLLSTTEAEPTTTFELRFAEPVAARSPTGFDGEPSPLVFQPPLAGRWTWLSQRSGVFTPGEPPALDTAYTLTLRPDLGARRTDEAAGGDGDTSPRRSFRPRLRYTFRTPPFSVLALPPPFLNREDAPPEPEFTLHFNANVRTNDARRCIAFRSAAGDRVPAKVAHAPAAEGSDFPGPIPMELTWRERFQLSVTNSPTPSARATTPAPVGSRTLPNSLLVWPARPLPPGTDWRLVVSRGLPAVEARLRLTETFELDVGRVKPFEVVEAVTESGPHSGKSIRVTFSRKLAATVNASNVASWVTVTPSPRHLEVEVFDRQLHLRGEYEVGPAYTLDIQPGLPGEEPLAFAGYFANDLVFTPLPPRLYFPGFDTDQLAGGRREFELLAVNVPAARVQAKQLDRATLVHALRGYRSYQRAFPGRYDYREPFRALDYNLIAGRTIYATNLVTANRLDVAERLPLQWDEILQGRRTGAVFLMAEQEPSGSGRPRPGTQAIVQLTDLGLAWKRAREELTVYVFSLTTGRPVAGAAMRLMTDENQAVAEGRTDARGLATLPLREGSQWLLAEAGEDLHALSLEGHDVHLYSFRLPLEWWSDDRERLRLFAFSDRPVYRPGETAHLKVLAREWRDDTLGLPAQLAVGLRCFDAKGQLFLRTNLTLSAAGSLDFSVALPRRPLGQYRAQFDWASNPFHHPFRVEEYQPNAFEIVLPAKPAYAADEPVELPLSAKYYLGKPLSRAQVRWSLEATDAGFAPAGFEAFAFCDGRTGDPWEREAASCALNGSGTFTDQTNFVLAPEIPLHAEAPQPRQARLEVEMTDLNQQTVAQGASFLRHSSDFYLGVRRFPEVLRAGDLLPVSLIAVGADGAPLTNPVTATVTLDRIDYQTVRLQGAGRTTRYRTEEVRTNVVETEVSSRRPRQTRQGWELAEGEGAPVALPLPAPGAYVLQARADDAGGRAVVTTLRFHVRGAGELAWDYRNEAQIELVPDQPRYTPGQTALLLVKTPVSGTALVTVERDTVLRSFTTELTGHAPSISVPLEERDAPNVFVSVLLLRGLADSPRKSPMPEHRLGYCQLRVEAPGRRLQVLVSPEACGYRPGDAITVTADVRDAAGQPVRDAEVTLYAVDEGVLSLTGHATPEPARFFSEPRPLAVRTALSLRDLLPEDPDRLHFGNKGYLVGGGGWGPRAVRKNFLACAIWNAALRTDKDGRVTARFPAPDSLTRYRVIAVAHAGADRFGSGVAAFEVSKPLMVEPALPRFANIGDRLLGRAVVHNQTARAGEVEVTLELDARATVVRVSEPGSRDDVSPGQSSAGAMRRLRLAAGGSGVVEFPLEFTQAGTGRWTWRARFVKDGANPEAEPRNPEGLDFTDAVQSTLEVGYPVPLRRELHLARVEAAETNLLAGADPQLLEGDGRVVVSVSDSRLSELGEAAEWLLQYPYGCVEQTGSSLIPWLAAAGLDPGRARALNLCKTPEESRAAIRAGIERLLSMQTESGGLSYWPGGAAPMLWGSAYGGLALGLAARLGHSVPEAPLRRLAAYLSDALRGASATRAGHELADHGLTLYTLALLKRPEPAYHALLFQRRAELPPEHRAVLALAILEAGGPGQMVEELLVRDPRPLRTQPGSDWFGCPAREPAVRLLAWLRHRPDAPAVEVLVAEVLGSRSRAHWTTTQGNAWALLALAEYARTADAPPGDTTGSIAWGTNAASLQLTAEARFIEREFPTSPALATEPLVLSNPSKRRLFTRVKVESYPAVARQPRQDRGYAVSRTYERLDDDRRPRPLEGLRVGDTVLVTLRVGVRTAAHYLAIDDPLPAVFEAIHPEFKSQQPTGTVAGATAFDDWLSDFREMRTDRVLFFRDHAPPGQYEIRYLARVRAAGAATAPGTKVEEMYHPERFGLTETMRVTSLPLD